MAPAKLLPYASAVLPISSGLTVGFSAGAPRDTDDGMPLTQSDDSTPLHSAKMW